MPEQEIINEGAFTSTARRKINNMFDEIYASVVDGTGDINANNITALNIAASAGAQVPDLRNTSNIGTPGTKVTAQEYGNGYTHITVLDLDFAPLLPTIPANAEGAGALIYTFPPGYYIGQGIHLKVTGATVDSATNGAEIGIGSQLAAGDISTLGISNLDWLDKQAIVDVSNITTEAAALMTNAVNLVFESGDSHSLYLNMAGTWNSTIASLEIKATITVAWTFLSS